MTCYFCSQNSKKIDFKDTDVLKRFVSAGMKIKTRQSTGVCSKHQRKLSTAIKQARQMSMLPYVP